MSGRRQCDRFQRRPDGQLGTDKMIWYFIWTGEPATPLTLLLLVFYYIAVLAIGYGIWKL
jgi:hypothetical protein